MTFKLQMQIKHLGAENYCYYPIIYTSDWVSEAVKAINDTHTPGLCFRLYISLDDIERGYFLVTANKQIRAHCDFDRFRVDFYLVVLRVCVPVLDQAAKGADND